MSALIDGEHSDCSMIVDYKYESTGNSNVTEMRKYVGGRVLQPLGPIPKDIWVFLYKENWQLFTRSLLPNASRCPPLRSK